MKTPRTFRTFATILVLVGVSLVLLPAPQIFASAVTLMPAKPNDKATVINLLKNNPNSVKTYATGNLQPNELANQIFNGSVWLIQNTQNDVIGFIAVQKLEYNIHGATPIEKAIEKVADPLEKKIGNVTMFIGESFQKKEVGTNACKQIIPTLFLQGYDVLTWAFKEDNEGSRKTGMYCGFNDDNKFKTTKGESVLIQIKPAK